MSVPASDRARTVGITTNFLNLRTNGAALLPQAIALIGQGNTAETYPTTKVQVTSARQVALLCGFGSPVHLAASQLFPSSNDGVGSIPVTLYPLEDAVSAVTAAGTITPAGTATAAGVLQIQVNGILSDGIAVAVGDTVALLTPKISTAINNVLEMPIIAVSDIADVDVTAKWGGPTGNDVQMFVIGEVAGITIAIVDPAGGSLNPDVNTALDQVGLDWETMVLSCFNLADTAVLDAFSLWNEGQWAPTVSQPAVVFTGSNEAVLATAIAVPDSRINDRTNSVLVAPGSPNLPFVIAAAELVKIVLLANSNPPHDYGSQLVSRLIPGLSSEQWTYNQRDQAMKAGTSSIQVKGGDIFLSDTVTFYHPAGEADPAYRSVVDVVKIQQIQYSLAQIFKTTEWDGAPLVPDDQATSEPTAKKPKMARGEIAAMIDSLAARAIISDPETAKATIVAAIDSGNPKRLNVSFTAQLSGNTNIIDVDFNFGFFFGELIAA